MKSVAFHIQKGGVGKTSCGGSVAAGLARKGHKTILVDCDQQGSASSWFLASPIDYELADAQAGKAATERTIIAMNIDRKLADLPPPSRTSSGYMGTKLRKIASVVSSPYLRSFVPISP